MTLISPLTPGEDHALPIGIMWIDCIRLRYKPPDKSLWLEHVVIVVIFFLQTGMCTQTDKMGRWTDYLPT